MITLSPEGIYNMHNKSSVFVDTAAVKLGIVAVIASRKDLRKALRRPNIAEIYEWRVDRIRGKRTIESIERLNLLGKKIILTVRDSSEGGQTTFKGENDLERQIARQQLIRRYLYLAWMVDIEINYAVRFRKLIVEIQRMGIRVNFSFHVLEPTPFKIMKLSLDWFIQVFELLCSRDDVFKIAVVIEDPEIMRLFSRYIYRLMKKFPRRIAPMPIGEKYGRRLRLEYARRGAALVYCCFDGVAVVSGQWPVAEFRQKL